MLRDNKGRLAAIAAAGAYATALLTLSSGATTVYAAAQGAKKQKAATVKKVAAVQKATVTINHGYEPGSVTVKAGRPVELTLVRKEASGCGNVVQFPSLGIKRTLKAGEKTVVKFTPKKSGNIAFACGMNMYRGQAVVK